MSTQLIFLDSDSDDNEVVLASNLTRTQQLPSPEPNEHDDDDFIMRHEQITKKINKSKRKNNTIDNDDDDVLSQQTNYAPYDYEALLQTNDDIYSEQTASHRDKYSTADKINILNELQRSFSSKNNNNNNPPQPQPIHIVSSDTNSSQNTIDAPDLFANCNQTNPIITNDDDYDYGAIPFENDTDNDAMTMIMEEAQIQRGITQNMQKKQAIQREKERLIKMEEEDNKFMQGFEKNKAKNIASPRPRNKHRTRDNKKEKVRRQLESDHAFSALFNQQNTRKRSRDHTEQNNVNTNRSPRKRQKRLKRHSLPSSGYDPNDPFSVHFASHSNSNQPLIAKAHKKRKKWSKSHRVSLSRKRNISSLSSQTQTETPTFKLLDQLLPPKKKKRKTPQTDPFHIAIPIMASPFTVKTEKPQKSGIKPPKSGIKPLKNKKKSNSSHSNKAYVPLCKQLHSLTCTDRADNISTFKPIQNINDLSIVSKLPHSNTRSSHNSHGHTAEDIEESRTTNTDLQYLQTPQRFKYKTRHQSDIAVTPKSLKRVSKMQTPNKTRSDKEEIDHSDDEHAAVVNERGDTPKWLNNLTDKAIASTSAQKKTLSKRSGKKKHNSRSRGKWQRDLRDLSLKIANRYNMVTMYTDCIDKMPANLGVTDKLILKILRIRRVSYYDLYQTVCVYYEANICAYAYALCYFDASKFEELQLEKYDFVTIYRPWNDMRYCGMDRYDNKQCDIRVLAAIDNVIKIFNVKQCVKEYDKYPKYDINVFKKVILAQKHKLEAIAGDVEICKMELDVDINDGDAVMDEMEDNLESFWLQQQNIDAIIEAERLRINSDYVNIAELPKDAMFDQTKSYNLRAMIQRIYTKEDGMENEVKLLVSDESGYCCMIVMNLRDLLENAFDSDFNDSLGDQLRHLMKLESIWFDFNDLHICNTKDSDYNQEIQCLLMQFQYLYLNGNAAHPNWKNMNKIKLERESSDIRCNGLELNKGNLLRDGKIYYHFEHFNRIQMNEYFKRLELRYFECKSLQKSSQQQQQSNRNVYEESLLVELNEIRFYLDKYWKTKRSSTRMSVCVRIVAKSLIFENVIYICDNSLLSALDPNIQCIPLIIDNMYLFQSVCKLHEMDNEYLYKNQPLLVLRDIAMYFMHNDEGNNGDLQLRFDSFSMIDDIKDMAIMAEHRQCQYKHHLFDMNTLGATPWIALNSSMIKINGSCNIELVSINDGFDVRCIECRKISLRSYKMKNDDVIQVLDDEDDDVDESKKVEGVACIDCCKRKGEIRMVLKRANDDFLVIVVAVINIWYKTSDLDKYSQGIVQVIDWKDHKTYLDALNTLKMHLCTLVDNGDDKLKQCVIEYELDSNANSDSIENVKCYDSFHCVI